MWKIKLFFLCMIMGFSYLYARQTMPSLNWSALPPEGQYYLRKLGLISRDCSLSNRFPQSVMRWCEWIEKYAQKHGIPANLIATVIWYESGGNPDAYSQSGAVGLMQVMPRDGLASEFVCNNQPCFKYRPATAKLYDPEFNIAYGTKLLASLYRQAESLREALRKYGPMDVGYWYADSVLALYHRTQAQNQTSMAD